MREGLKADSRGESLGLIVVLTVVSLAGAVIIGLIVLSYNDSDVNDDFSYYVDLGPVIKDGSKNGVYEIAIDSRVGTPYTSFDLSVNNHTSKKNLAGFIGNDSAWHVDGMSIYVDDVNNNSLCDRGDRIVVISDLSGPDRAVELVVRNVQFGMKLDSVTFVLEGAVVDK